MKSRIIAFGILCFLCIRPAFSQVNIEQVTTPTTLISFDQVPLNGIITAPLATAPKAIALIIQGSGNVGADGDVSSPFVGAAGYQGQPTQLSVELAQALTNAGVASYRYDKRGFADANIRNTQQTFPYLKSDAEAAAQMLQQKYPGLPLFLVGFSEGALVAIHAAVDLNPKGLFLLSPPPGNINDWLRFMLFEWPIQVLNQVDADHNGVITTAEFNAKGSAVTLPMMGAAWNTIDANKDGSLDLATEIVPAYQTFYTQTLGLIETPAYHDWYYSFLPLEDPSVALKQYSGNVWSYHATNDSQFNWLDSVALVQTAPHLMKQRMYENLGHCFSPFEGEIGEIKTSGPFDNKLLNDFTTDLQSAL